MTYRRQLDELITGYREDWRDDAGCNGLDPEIFFLDRGQSARPAKTICNGCPVRIECLAFALRNNEQFGVWGGMTDQDRKKIRRKKQMPAETAVEISEESP